MESERWKLDREVERLKLGARNDGIGARATSLQSSKSEIQYKQVKFASRNDADRFTQKGAKSAKEQAGFREFASSREPSSEVCLVSALIHTFLWNAFASAGSVAA
jgi:hypothetical protein